MNTRKAAKKGRPSTLGPDAVSITFRLPADVGHALLIQKQFDETEEGKPCSMSATIVNLLRAALAAQTKSRARAEK